MKEKASSDTEEGKRIFDDETYKALERESQKSSHLLGIEEALDAIREDTQLQNILRAYARRNGIEKRGWAKYCIGDPLRGLSEFADCKIKFYETKDKKNFLTIHLDFNEKVMPLFYNYWYKARHGAGYFTDYEGHFLIVRREKGYYLEDNPEYKEKHYGHGMRMIDLGRFIGVTKEEILQELEHAVKNLAEKKR